MQLDHVQSFMHNCWPLPTSVAQSSRACGMHALGGSTQARTPVVGLQTPERVPQLPQGVVVGSVQLSEVIAHSDQRHSELHVCLPLPAAVEQSMPELGAHAPTGSMQARRPVRPSHSPMRIPQLPHGVSSGCVQLSELI